MFQLSNETKEMIKKELSRYESKRSAIIPCLYLVQKENDGWINADAIARLSEAMDLPEAQIQEVFSFYTMFNQKPVGKYHVQVCCNISCAMNGARELLDQLCSTFQVKVGEVTSDGRFSFSPVECLGSCGTAPMMQVNDDYLEDLDLEKATMKLRELK